MEIPATDGAAVAEVPEIYKLMKDEWLAFARYWGHECLEYPYKPLLAGGVDIQRLDQIAEHIGERFFRSVLLDEAREVIQRLNMQGCCTDEPEW